ncbi:MAG: hypothetical protein J6X42_02655 [Alphaproteobacteria bacterium]|nr:hypothetical protein [Alphaproteobacteria bacterium]
MDKFEKEFQIRSYECDQDGYLRVVTLMNILQDAADASATALGFGFDFCIRNNVAWVGTNYHVVIKKMPKIHEKIKVLTWPSGENKFMALRDFIILDAKGNQMILATSQWVLVDAVRKRPISLAQYLPNYMYINERVLSTEFVKLGSVDNTEVSKEFEARFDDIDLNRHVNNAIYPLWATETLSNDFLHHHIPAEIEISYKKECLYGEHVTVKTNLDSLTSLHTVAQQDKELAHLRITWQEKAAS